MKRILRTATAALAAAAVAGVLTLSACSPSTNDNPTGDSGSAAAATPVAWSMDGDCAICHATEEDSSSDPSCLASMHANNDCIACHADEATLETVHADATADGPMPKKLKKTEVSEDACFSCHGDMDALAEATSASTLLTDGQGKTVNPHAVPESESHSTMVCGDCHSMHASEDIAETAPQACLNCHHENVYECGTCHE